MSVDYQFSVAGLSAAYQPHAPVANFSGANAVLECAAYAATGSMYRSGTLQLPPVGVIGTGNVELEAWCQAEIGASANVELEFQELARNPGQSFDASYTSHESGASAVQTTTGQWTKVAWSVDIGTLGWAGNQLVQFRLTRNTGANDTLTTQLLVDTFIVRVPTL